jgi:hypothetical protein
MSFSLRNRAMRDDLPGSLELVQVTLVFWAHYSKLQGRKEQVETTIAGAAFT